jgi:Ca2+-binding RTX toxin-like protein
MTTIVGTERGEVIRGSGGRDFLDGLGGNDRIEANRGDDRVEGGRGNDYLAGGAGRDFIRGEDGLDWLLGGADDDVLDPGVDVYRDIVSFKVTPTFQNGADLVHNFDPGEDVIDLGQRAVSFDELDVSGDGIIDGSDDGCWNWSGDLTMDIGAIAGYGDQNITIAGVTQLDEGDFIFTP